MSQTLLPPSCASSTAHSAPDTLVLYHGDGCHDGFGAAYVAWTQLGDRAIYHPVLHGDVEHGATWPAAWPDAHGKHVLVLDYALPVAMLHEVQAHAASFTQLDHHDTAYQTYKAHGCCGNGCLFDLNHSGVMLAWQHFHGDTPAPDFILDLEDQDLWRFRRATTVPFARGARTRAMSFEVWDTFNDPVVYEQVVNDGRVLEAQWQHWLHEVAEQAVPVNLLGEPGLMVCANGAYRSDLGSLLASRSGTYGLMWHGRPNGGIACSLRSVDVPCKPLAQRLGGGGHDHASGFRRPSLANFKTLVGMAWDLNAPPVWAGEPNPHRLSEDERSAAAWARVEGWQTAQRSPSMGLRSVDHSVDHSVDSNVAQRVMTPAQRQASGRLLEAHRQQVIESVVVDALIEPLPLPPVPPRTSSTSSWTGQESLEDHQDRTPGLANRPNGTRATVITDSTLLPEVVERLLDQGHLAVQTIRVTRTGIERRAHGTAEHVLAAWPDVQGVTLTHRPATAQEVPDDERGPLTEVAIVSTSLSRPRLR